MKMLKIFFMTCMIFLKMQYIDMLPFSAIESLYNNLTVGYNKHLRPKKELDLPTHISMDFYIITLHDINAVDGTMSITGFFNITWTDDNMKWLPSDYENASVITLPYDRVWRPPLLNCNTAQQYQMFGLPDTYVQVHHSGVVEWLPGEYLEFSCDIDTSYFPFDQQVCNLDITAWGYKPGDIMFAESSKTVQMMAYTESSEWDLIQTSAEHIDNVPPKMVYTFAYKRRPLFLIINLILPVVFMSLLNICVFMLPHDSGERIGFAITLLLAVVLFLTIAQSMLPATAKPRLSAICVLLSTNLFMSGVIVVSVVLSSWVYTRSSEKSIPFWVEKVVRFRLFGKINKKNEVQNIGFEQHAKGMDSEKLPKLEYDWIPKENITWQQVARTLDKIILTACALIFIVSNISYLFNVM